MSFLPGKALAALAVLSACGGTVAQPIVPARLATAGVDYKDASGRGFMAPPGGEVSANTEDVVVTYGNQATLTVTAISLGGESVSENTIERALHNVPRMRGQPLMKEESPGVAIFCMANGPIAACARVDEASRAKSMMVLSTFVASPQAFGDMGGARVAAEAARTGQGFNPPAALPPP